MAGLGRKTFAQEEVLRAADVNGYLMDQSVMRFANGTARGSAIPTPSEGMVSYLDDANAVQVYDGSNWVAVGQDLTTGTQGFTALSNGTAGLTYQPVSHNYIINGAFDVWQRGDSFTVTTGNPYTADRWLFQTSGALGVVSRQSFTPNELNALGFGDASSYLRLAVSLGDNNAAIVQTIEDVRTLAGQTVTLSFYAKGTNPGDGEFQVRTRQLFGSGGSATNEQIHGLRSITSTWARYSLTFDIDNVSGKTIGAGSHLWVDIRQPAEDTTTAPWTLDIWGVQLEAGSVATPFKRHAPSLQGELAACKRYYQRWYPPASLSRFGVGHTSGSGAFPNQALLMVYFTEEMRIPPTALEQSGTGSDYSIFTPTGAIACNNVPVFDQATTWSITVRFQFSSLTAGVPVFGRAVNTNAFLGWSAEL